MTLPRAITEHLAAGGLELQPFQRRWLGRAFSPTCSIACLSGARGLGKTELAGRLAAMAVQEGSPLFAPGRGVVLFAGSMRQATALYEAALNALPAAVREDGAAGGIKARNDTTHTVEITGPRGTFVEIFPSSGKRALGLGARQSLIICDEPASWEDRNGELLWSAVKTSLGKIPNQRALVIGTLAPARPTHWWPKLVAAGTDGRTYVQLHAGREQDRWDAWSTATRANPLLRASPHLADVVRDERAKALRDPDLQAEYEALRLNRMALGASTSLVSVEDWRQCLDRPAPERDGPAAVGIDLGAQWSMSAAVALWWSGRCEAWAVVPGIPDLAEQERRYALPRGALERLRAGGRLAAADGRRVADHGMLLDLVQRSGVQVAGIVADRFASSALADLVAERRLPAPEWRVNQWSTATEDIAAMRRTCLDGPLAIEATSRPLVTLGVASATTARDSSGNVRLVKTNLRQRDDVAQALCLAAGAVARYPRPAAGTPFRFSPLA